MCSSAEYFCSHHIQAHLKFYGSFPGRNIRVTSTLSPSPYDRASQAEGVRILQGGHRVSDY
jgi:hypothetical protein